MRQHAVDDSDTCVVQSSMSVLASNHYEITYSGDCYGEWVVGSNMEAHVAPW